MQNNFDTHVQLDEIHPEVDDMELRSLAREYATWLEYQLYSRVAASGEKEASCKN